MTTLRLSGSSVIRDNHSSSEPPMAAGGIYVDDTSQVLGVRCAPHGDANVLGNTPNDRDIEKPVGTQGRGASDDGTAGADDDA